MQKNITILIAPNFEGMLHFFKSSFTCVNISKKMCSIFMGNLYKSILIRTKIHMCVFLVNFTIFGKRNIFYKTFDYIIKFSKS